MSIGFEHITGYENVFDGINNGIVLERSNAIISNNVLKNFPGGPRPSVPTGSMSGFGIFAFESNQIIIKDDIISNFGNNGVFSNFSRLDITNNLSYLDSLEKDSVYKDAITRISTVDSNITTVIYNNFQDIESKLSTVFNQISSRTYTDSFCQVNADALVQFYEFYKYAISDTAKVLQMALECPYTYGRAVYLSRNLYETTMDTVISWDSLNTCPSVSAIVTNTSDVPRAGRMEISLYPNPVTNISYLQVDKFESGDRYRYDIINVTGVKMENKLISSAVSKLDLSSWENGTWFVNVYFEDRLIKTIKLIKI